MLQSHILKDLMMHDTDCMLRINHKNKKVHIMKIKKSFCKVQVGLVPLNLLSAARVLRFFFRRVTGSVMVIGWLLSIPNPKINKKIEKK